MSCSLLSKEDWLDNSFSANSNKVIFFLLAVLGASLLYFQIKMEVGCIKTDSSLSTLFRIFQFTSIFILLVSIIMLVISWTTSIDFKGNLLKFGVGTVILTNLLILAITIGIYVEFNKLNCEFDNLVWIPVGIMTLLSLFLGYYAFKAETSIKNLITPDQDIRWENVNTNADLIENIGQKQAKQCNLVLEEGESIASFNAYLKERNSKFSSEHNFITRAFKSPPKLPGDKIPNIIKMNHRMIESGKSLEKYKNYEETQKMISRQRQKAIENPLKPQEDNSSPSTLETMKSYLSENAQNMFRKN